MHARIRAGDPDAFRELFRDQTQLVCRHAVRTTGEWSEAEDVVSLTFLEAWRLRDEGASPRPWLMGIAVNVLRNTGRAARRHERAPAPRAADATTGNRLWELSEELTSVRFGPPAAG